MTLRETPVLEAGTCRPVPVWASAQRALLDELDLAWREFAARYCAPDGRLVFTDRLGQPPDDRDGVDDFYEPFFNWPLLYLLGGADDLLPAVHHHWTGVTAQLTEQGMLIDGFERGYDWFHQGEGMLLFQLLCLADPGSPVLRATAARFADLYADPAAGNYDADRNIIRAPHTGGGGPRPGLTDSGPLFPWSPVFSRYGLPLDWLPGIERYEQLEDPAAAAAYGAEMATRMGRGDVAVNLAATSLVTTAFALAGDPRHRDWVLRYVAGWQERAAANGGLLPDNVGLAGEVGEYLGGRWYGGHYGWAWPHGVHSVGTAAVVAAQNALLLSGDPGHLDLGRGPLDAVLRHRRSLVPDPSACRSSRWIPWVEQGTGRPTQVVPLRHGERGWFDPEPLKTALPTALWAMGQHQADSERIALIRRESGYDWTVLHAFRDKEESGHEPPWLAYLAGDAPAFPEQAMATARAVVDRQRRLIAAETTDPTTGPSAADIHLWQQRNPVCVEALVQLTCGGPQIVYNGGLLHTRLRHFDAVARRPGLPPDVAALVHTLSADRVGVTLVNTGGAARRVLVQAGAFAEHRFSSVSADGGPPVALDTGVLTVTLPPGHQIDLLLGTQLHVRPPNAHPPWSPRRGDRSQAVTPSAPVRTS